MKKIIMDAINCLDKKKDLLLIELLNQKLEKYVNCDDYTPIVDDRHVQRANSEAHAKLRNFLCDSNDKIKKCNKIIDNSQCINCKHHTKEIIKSRYGYGDHTYHVNSPDKDVCNSCIKRIEVIDNYLCKLEDDISEDVEDYLKKNNQLIILKSYIFKINSQLFKLKSQKK